MEEEEEEDATAQIHDQEEEEDDDDALSLSDLPITATPPIDEINTSSSTSRKILPRRSSSEPADFFEFLHSEDSIIMSHAEDIFFCGKLVPFDFDPHQKRPSFYRRRSESFPDPIIISPSSSSSSTSRARARARGSGGGTRTTEEGIPLIRRKKLRRNFSSLSEKTLIRSNNSSIKSEISTKSSVNSTPKHTTTSTSRWLFLIFGFVKPLPEMDLSDIKSRQIRRPPTTMFPHFIGGGGGKRHNSSSGRRRPPEGKRRSSWRLLSVLSCRGHTSVAVTTPFGCLPA